MKNLLHSILVLFLLSLISCSVEPEAIKYGENSCDFCRMTIVDQLHGAEIVSSKGKIYKFDASECMLNFKKENSELEIAMHLTNHYLEPGELIDATTATFLISEEIPSPMGGNLSAFASLEEAEQIQNKHSGIILTWNELKKRYIKP